MLGHQVPEQLLPDVALVGELSDSAELGKLLQLILGCAISCEKKQGMCVQFDSMEGEMIRLHRHLCQENILAVSTLNIGMERLASSCPKCGVAFLFTVNS